MYKLEQGHARLIKCSSHTSPQHSKVTDLVYFYSKFTFQELINGCWYMILVSTTFQGSDHIVDQFSTVVAARIDCSPPINLQHHNLFTAIHSAAMHQIDHNLFDIRSQRTHNSEGSRRTKELKNHRNLSISRG